MQKNNNDEIAHDILEEELGGRTYAGGGRGIAPNGSRTGGATGAAKVGVPWGTAALQSNVVHLVIINYINIYQLKATSEKNSMKNWIEIALRVSYLQSFTEFVSI